MATNHQLTNVVTASVLTDWFGRRRLGFPRPRLLRRKRRLWLVALGAASAYLVFSTASLAAAGDTSPSTETAAQPGPPSPASDASAMLPAPSESEAPGSGAGPLVSAQYHGKTADTGADSTLSGAGQDEPTTTTSAAAETPGSVEAAASPMADATAGDPPPIAKPGLSGVPRAKARSGSASLRSLPGLLETGPPGRMHGWYRLKHFRYQLNEAVSQQKTNQARRTTAIISRYRSTLAPASNKQDAKTTARHGVKNPVRILSKIPKQIAKQNKPGVHGVIPGGLVRASLRPQARKLVGVRVWGPRPDTTWRPARIKSRPGPGSFASSRPGPSVSSESEPALDPKPVAAGRPADGRRLLQLGLVLGIAYVLFLVFWFWRTRGLRHRLGRAVRS